MFKSRWLDALSRVHTAVPVVIFGPVTLIAFVLGATRVGLLGAIGAAAVGYVVWTLTEYWLHRLVFHFEPEQGIGARLHWMIHGVHHDHPNDPLRLVMPPAASTPLPALVIGPIWLVAGTVLAPAVAAGFLAGYLIYDEIHYAIAQHMPKSRLGRKLR